MSKADLSLSVVKLSEELRQSGGWPAADLLDRLAAEIGSAFGAGTDEVAILFLSKEGMLSFMYPLKFAKLGSIPISAGHSLAVRTVREKRGEVVNNFSVYKHPTVFESVNPTEAAKAAPIQKIMSAPMTAGGKTVGVIQVSRKGRAGDPLGPDFTAQDLAELTTAGSILAKVFATLTPPSAKR